MFIKIFKLRFTVALSLQIYMIYHSSKTSVKKGVIKNSKLLFKALQVTFLKNAEGGT